MLKIPKYTQYNGERKIALLDNSTIEFMLDLTRKGYKPEEVLRIYDVILLPNWVAEEVKDSTYRVDYINGLARNGYPIHLVEEKSYSDLTDGQEMNLYEIVYAAVYRLGEIRSYIRKNVKCNDPLDMDEYSRWIEKLYLEWPMQTTETPTGRVKKKNAGEISLTILSEIFSWYYPEVDALTIYTQDKDTYEFQKYAENKLEDVFKSKIPVTVTFYSNDSIIRQMYKKNIISIETIKTIRKNPRSVTYTVTREDGSTALQTRRLETIEFIELIEDENSQIIF